MFVPPVLTPEQRVPLSKTALHCCQDWAEFMCAASLETRTQYNDAFWKHVSSHDKAHPKNGNGLYQGAFAFTLTKSPKDPQTVQDMIMAARKIMAQQSFPVKRYAWYLEDKGQDHLGEPLHPHIHGMYETESGKRIESKHFKRAWPLWDPATKMGQGFRGGYHRPVEYGEEYAKYIQEDGGTSESKI